MGARPILVLGMHRSGTSCLAGSLQQRGLFLGDVYESRPHNPKGNREHQQVMDVNNAVLAGSGGAWDRPPVALRWGPGEVAARDAVVDLLRTGSGGGPWGFKDPRTLLTLDFWRDALPDARLVATFRDPGCVARSLRARDPGMSFEAGLELWADYNQRLLALHAREAFPIVSFDTEAAAYAATVDRLAGHLDLSDAAEGEPFFEGSLQHQQAGAVPPRHEALYQALVDASTRWAP